MITTTDSSRQSDFFPISICASQFLLKSVQIPGPYTANTNVCSRKIVKNLLQSSKWVEMNSVGTIFHQFYSLSQRSCY